MRPSVALMTAAMLGMLVLSACGPTVASPPSQQAKPSSPPASPVPAPTIDPSAQAAVDAALRDAATVLGVPASQLQVVQVEAVDWSDSSLGCPRPGMMYMQVITPGYRIVISGGGRQVEYHSDENGRVVLCAQP